MWRSLFLKRYFGRFAEFLRHIISAISCGENVPSPYFLGGSTMFDQLFKSPVVLARHRTGPLLEERLSFLAHLANQGYSRTQLRRNANGLLVIAQMLGAGSRPRTPITAERLKHKLAKRPRLYPLATRWLLFTGRLRLRPTAVTPCAKKIQAFAQHLEQEQERSLATVHTYCWLLSQFFDRLRGKGDSLREITPQRIDRALQKLADPGGYSRNTIRNWVYALRAFFRFAAARGWCREGLAAGIWGPRVFTQALLPRGPSWDDVRRLLASTEGDQPPHVRARAILMLFAVYGLRAGEVGRLRLEDFDWEQEVFRVVSSKTKRIRTYPLTRSVGDAIVRYLQEVRPRSPHRELFLSLRAPFRPVRKSLWSLVADRLRSLHVSLSHYGPHVLRHACATRLLAAGLSLKEIGDQLGHADPNSTRIYAKVDLVSLRQVADFDLGGVL
jgi:site-specific recombinase XerD